MSLQKGTVFTLSGQRWKVAYVNASRAHCVNVTRRTVELRDRRTGKIRRFVTTQTGALDISPNTDLSVLRDLGL